MQNTIHSLEDLFAVNTFRIPQYQRAYSWEREPHLEAFLDDLRQQVRIQSKARSKHYYLGTLLLHEEIGNGRHEVNIVDGQQRLTTSVIFIATALKLLTAAKIAFQTEKAAVLRRHFVHDPDDDLQKFHTIREDEPFFQSAILGTSAINCEEDSPSSRRLREAAEYFSTTVAADEWESLIYALKTSRVMVYAVDNAEDATQIFELQNDRGKSLTSLEALKSFLMHCVYLHSAARADDRLASLQTLFSKIYRIVETLGEFKGAPDEDQLLTNHCTAFLKWSEKDFNNPKNLVKTTIKAMQGAIVIPWIEEFVSSLVESYRTIEEVFRQRDSLQEFSELLLLGRMGSYWPLILKAWRSDKSADKHDFRKACRLLEVFTFRGYAIANLRADTSVSSFQTAARDFKGNFEELFDHLGETCRWHNLESRFEAGLDNPFFYETEGRDALYLLWRYENYLRGQRGKTQSLLSWRDYDEPRSDAAKFNVEHIAAQADPIAENAVVWGEGAPQPFREVALHRLGNLVIDTFSLNASKGKKDFANKLESLSKSSAYLSQSELINFIPDPKHLVWDVKAIQTRHKQLIAFSSNAWNPDTWHRPSRNSTSI